MPFQKPGQFYKKNIDYKPLIVFISIQFFCRTQKNSKVLQEQLNASIATQRKLRLKDLQ